MLNSNIVLGTETGKEIIHGSQIYLQYKSHDEPGQYFTQKGKYIHLAFDDSLVLSTADNKLILQRKSKF